jgi:hypothetical protein
VSAFRWNEFLGLSRFLLDQCLAGTGHSPWEATLRTCVTYASLAAHNSLRDTLTKRLGRSVERVLSASEIATYLPEAFPKASPSDFKPLEADLSTLLEWQTRCNEEGTRISEIEVWAKKAVEVSEGILRRLAVLESDCPAGERQAL